MVSSLAVIIVAMTVLACAAPAGRPTSERTVDRSVSPAPRAERYVAIGASDTVGVGASDPVTGSWPARIAARLPAASTYTNLGVSGSLAAQARAEQVPAAIAARPTLITIWLAVNDLNHGITPTAYRDALRGILDTLVGRTEARIFVANVPDLTAVPRYEGTDRAALAEQVRAYNRWIAETVGCYPGRVVPVDLFAGSAALMGSVTVSADGFHPSDEGYRLIAERFVAALRANGVALRD